MQNLNSTDKKQETAILVALIHQKQGVEKTQEYLDELAFLAATAGILTLKTFTQRLERPDIKTFVGKGKLEDIAAYQKHHDVNLVIFDDELNASQLRNLEQLLNCRILDRSMLILKIFMLRAKTAQAKIQVELANYQYILPRLTRLWSHHSRQKGGIGLRGGPGETELETDRRIVRDKISLLKEKLELIEKQAFTQRKSREALVRVALVGYTNVGKSTLMNLLSKSEVFAENKLFATVDATVRKVVLDQTPFLLTDTVGFIRKLPTTLIECFKSTLAEIVEADILLHVIDVSHESYEEHIEVVNKTLAEIGAANKTIILVFNKIDLYKNEEIVNNDDALTSTMEQLQATYIGKNPQEDRKAIFISALQKEGINDLRALLAKQVAKIHFTIYPNYH